MRLKIPFSLLSRYKFKHSAKEVDANDFIIILFVILKFFAKLKNLGSLLLSHLFSYFNE